MRIRAAPGCELTRLRRRRRHLLEPFPRRLFDRSGFLVNPRFDSYAVSPDGKRFLMIQRDPGSVPRQLNVILNWSDAVN